MTPNSSLEINEATELLLQLADMVEDTGLSACDVGNLLMDAFRQSSQEQSAEIRQQVLELTRCDVTPASFASRLRWQAHQLQN